MLQIQFAKIGHYHEDNSFIQSLKPLYGNLSEIKSLYRPIGGPARQYPQLDQDQMESAELS
jgi:hypothetical protein